VPRPGGTSGSNRNGPGETEGRNPGRESEITNACMILYPFDANSTLHVLLMILVDSNIDCSVREDSGSRLECPGLVVGEVRSAVLDFGEVVFSES
jgi:hypothetical protein